MDKEPKQKLIKAFVKSVKALREDGAIRSRNIVADYAEFLVCETLRLERAKKSQKGFDAIDKKAKPKNINVQIKSRWMDSKAKTPSSNRELGSLGRMETKGFDYLIAVLFDDNLMIDKALKISYEIAKEYRIKTGEYYKLRLNNTIMSDKRVEDIKPEFPEWCKT